MISYSIGIDLKDGEIICPKCGGSRILCTKEYERTIIQMCTKCLGDGKLDWVERITGKNKQYYDSAQLKIRLD